MDRSRKSLIQSNEFFKTALSVVFGIATDQLGSSLPQGLNFLSLANPGIATLLWR